MSKDFLVEFNRIKQSLEEGKTPVYSEVRSVKTSLKELIPSLIIQSILLIISTIIIASIPMSELVSVVVLLVANTTTQTLSFAIMTLIKHHIRVRILKKYDLEVCEHNIAVLESMEYQSV